MATRNFSYDHPAYLAVLPADLGFNAAGASAALSGRFTAFTTTLIKSVTARVITSGTSTTHAVFARIYAATGTAISTAALMTLGSSGHVQATTTLTLTKGETLALVLGTDATEVIAAMAEMAILPGADVTV
jgi:hypothetical protein